MNRTTRQAFRTELLRSAAPVAAAGVLVAGALSMYSLAGGWAGWPGRWMPFAASVRMSLFVVGAIAVGCAAWQGGRERRRRIGDQLNSTARPAWQPVVLGWAAVTIGAVLALLVLVGAGAALVAPVASYAGGGWWWVLAVSLPGLAALSALGFALGRLVPSRLTAPVAGIGAYLLMVGAIDTTELGGVRWLAPVMSQYDGLGYRLDGSVSAQQALWFAGLAATARVLVAARRRSLVAVPAGVAAAAAVMLVTEPVESWQRDPQASEQVCTDDAPEVCLTRVNAFVLDDMAQAARDLLARWDGVPGRPTRAVEVGSLVRTGAELEPFEPDGAVMLVQLHSGLTMTGSLAEPDEYQGWLEWWPETGCDDDAFIRHHHVFQVAAAWGTGAHRPWLEPEQLTALEALEGIPIADQRDWMGAVVEAARACDEAVLAELADDLR